MTGTELSKDSPTPPRKDTTVFIVEDESIVAEDLKAIVENLGFDVVGTERNGSKALGFIREHAPDIILMDIRLEGGLDGTEVTDRLDDSPPPVIYLTAHTDQQTLDRAKRTNPLGYITKPINEASLRTTLDVALERKKTLRQLQRTKNRYQTLVEANPDLILQVDPDGTIEFISENIGDIGYNPKDLIGEHFSELFHPEDYDETNRDGVLKDYRGEETGTGEAPGLLDERRTGQRSTRNLEVRLRPGDESLMEGFNRDFPVFEVNSSGLYDRSTESERKEFLGSVLVMRDVTRRVIAQEELRLKERAMASAREGITIAEAGDGEDDSLLFVNQGFLDITGYERDEVLGQDCRFLQGEATDPGTVATIRKAINNEQPVSVELKNYRKNGEMFWNQVSITPIRDEEGTVTHFVGIQQEITDQKRQEEELRRAEKLAAIGEMSAGLMHEINNPNAFIQGNIDYLRKAWVRVRNTVQESAGDDGSLQSILDEFEGTLEDMRQGTERIEEIVNKVKMFSRREQAVTQHERYDPIPVIEDTLTTLEVENDDFIEAHLSDEGSTIEGDPTEMAQIVTNLVNNARDAVEDQDNKSIRIEAGFRDGNFVLSVEDNGHGIPEDVRSWIFDPFFTTKPTGEGTGLGLSIVKGILDRAGGRIDVDSKEGSGARFDVTIPRAD